MRSVLCAAILAAACGNQPAEPPPAKSADGFVLVTPGVAPLRQLRYRPVKGATSRFDMSMNFDLESGGTVNTMPTLTLDLELAVIDVAADGSATLRTTIKHASATDRGAGAGVSAAQMNEGLRLFDNVVITSTLSPQGRQRDSKVSAGKDLAPALMQQITTMTQGLEQLAMPMPDQPVGVGAKWRSVKQLAQNGIDMTSTTTIDITAIEGDRVSFASSTQLAGPDQTLKQGTRSVTIAKVGGNGGGSGTVDLARLAMSGELRAEFKSEATSEGKTAPLRFAMVMQVKPKP
ncbi:MAG: hypothetical protein WKG01_09060 [Kofleriaceae bacterium]